jgi:hypothetical protein
MYTSAQVNPAGCLDGENIFCKMSDDRINELIDAVDDTDDRFRFTQGSSDDGQYFWNTTTPFSYDNNDGSSDWWKASLSIGGGHSPGCKHSDARGVGHYPTESSCSPYGDVETYFFDTDEEYTGSPDTLKSDFAWWVR